MARLKSLDEFEKPEFAGRMARVERRRKLEWWVMVTAAFAVGGAIGLVLDLISALPPQSPNS